MFTITTLPRRLFTRSACALALAAGVSGIGRAQDPLMMLGNHSMTFPALGGSGIQSVVLPTSNSPSIDDAYEYQGQLAGYAQSVQYDLTGNVQFFIKDGRIYNYQGLLIADNEDDPNCQVCMRRGASRIAIVPISDTCSQYLVISTSDNTDRVNEDYTILRMGILDMSLVNDFPYYQTNNITAMGRFLHENDIYLQDGFDFLWVNNPIGTQPPNHWVEGSLGLAYLSDQEMKYSLVGPEARDVGRIDVIEVEWGRYLIACESAMAINFFYSDDRGPHFLEAFRKVDYGVLYAEDFRSVRGELEMKRIGNTLRLAYGYNEQGEGWTPQFHDLRIAYWEFTLSGFMAGTPSIAVSPGPNNPRDYVVEQYTGDGAQPALDHFANQITVPRVVGLEFSPYAQYLYFLKSSYETAPYTNLGYIDVTAWPAGPALLPISTVTELIDSELELATHPSGIGNAIYALGTSGAGQYWLGMLENPDNPDPANWQAQVPGTDLTDIAVHTLSGDVQYRMLNSRVDGVTHINTLRSLECCAENIKIYPGTEPGFYFSSAMNGTVSLSNPWRPGTNPFFGAPDEVTFYQNFVVEAGAYLYVKDMTWRFGPNARLVIRPGAYVRFENCTLTNWVCDRWPGIRVEGTSSNTNQSSTAQGRLYLVESEVSNAVVGAWCAREDPFTKNPVAGFFGGRIHATNSVFRNCRTGVRIQTYQRYVGGNPAPNLCLFYNCSFLTDGEWPDPGVTTPQTHAHLMRCNGVRFLRCNFRNLSTPPDPNVGTGAGIQAIQASFYCNGYSDHANNAFSDLKEAVSVQQSSPLWVTTVNGMGFYSNWYGIIDYGDDDNVFTNNHFVTEEQLVKPNEASVGIYLFQSTRYTVERNLFTKQSGSPQLGIGIYFRGPVPMNNQIYNNEFYHLTAGCVVEGDHKGVNGSGLQLLCGDHEFNVRDQLMLEDAYIRLGQGIPNNINNLAGNRFLTAPNCSSEWEIFVDPNHPSLISSPPGLPMGVTYNHHGGVLNPQCKPECPAYYAGQYDLAEFFPSNYFIKEVHCSSGVSDLGLPNDPPVEMANYREKQAELRSAILNYRGTVDQGDTPDLIEAINSTAPLYASYQLRDMLLSKHPLSDQVMTTAIHRETPMDPWHLSQVLINNSPLTDGIWYELETSQVLSSFFLGLLEQYGQGYSTRRLLEMEIGQRSYEKYRLQQRLMLALAEDSTLTGKVDSLYVVFLTDSLEHGERHSFLLDLHNGEFQNAAALATELEMENASVVLAAYGRLWIDVEGEWDSTDTGQRAQLATLAFDSDHYGNALAWATLLQLGDTDSLPPAYLPLEFRSLFFAGPRVRGGATREAALGIYPNPARDRMMVTVPEGMEAGSLECFDSQGRLVRTISLNSQNALVEVDLQGWAEGIYMVRLIYEGLAVADGKLTVVR